MHPRLSVLDSPHPRDDRAVVFRVGPVKATFGGKVTLSDLDPPNSYRISGEGSGGGAGFAKGGAAVRLESDGPDVTVLHYDVDAQIGGKLAQLGARLIDSTAKKLAGEFFTSLDRLLAELQGSCGSGAQGLVGQADWRGLAIVVCSRSSLRSTVIATEAKQSNLLSRQDGLLRFARDDVDRPQCACLELYRARLTCQTSLQVLQQRPANGHAERRRER